MTPPFNVLAYYDLPHPLHPRALGNAGGFSGARLWRVPGPLGDWCLRAWPVGQVIPTRLKWIHDLMTQARQAGLNFVPAVLPTLAGTTFIEHNGQLWDICAWMPGEADYWKHPSTARLEAACTALARIHQAWQPSMPSVKLCPAWLRRRAKALEWLSLCQSWRPVFTELDPVAEAARRAWMALLRYGPWLQRELVEHEAPRVAVQPCLCDPWHDHVLFARDQVSGVIDFGSVKEDHVVVDLARLLGSLVEDDDNAWSIGLKAYQSVRSITPKEIDLARRLDRTGVLLAAANWLRWLLVENRTFANGTAIAERLTRLLRRMEGWKI